MLDLNRVLLGPIPPEPSLRRHALNVLIGWWKAPPTRAQPYCRDCGRPMAAEDDTTWSCFCGSVLVRGEPTTYVAILGGDTAIGGEPQRGAVRDILPYDEGPSPSKSDSASPSLGYVSLRGRLDAAMDEAFAGGLDRDEIRHLTDAALKTVADWATEWCGWRVEVCDRCGLPVGGRRHEGRCICGIGVGGMAVHRVVPLAALLNEAGTAEGLNAKRDEE